MKKILTKIFLVVFLFFGVTLNSNALYHVNDIVPPFPDPDQEIIEGNIIDGATFYFRGKAAAMNIFAVGESGAKSLFDFSSALSYTYTAIEYLQKAKSSYLKAYNLGKAAGYVKSSQDVLVNFDYDTFADEQGLNKIIMERVKAYLGKGDVTGFYLQAVKYVDEISEILTIIENDLEKGVKPDTRVFWRLLQKFSESTLFGNYGTMVGIAAFKN
jgi:hypothetical protein